MKLNVSNKLKTLNKQKKKKKKKVDTSSYFEGGKCNK